MKYSALHNARLAYVPKIPAILKSGTTTLRAIAQKTIEPLEDKERLGALFPLTYGQVSIGFDTGTPNLQISKLRVGVLLSGGPAPGGHNVITGLFDAMKAANTESVLLGFKGGAAGLIQNNAIELHTNLIASYRNTGGFDIIGSGRTKIETPEQFASALTTAKKQELSALVIVGGDDSNTNAALLAEYFAQKKQNTAIIGVPKTIDGDLKNNFIEASFGFDTAAKTYSELIGNICKDAASSRKYWHFIKLMGRSASHITLECALQTHPNICFISEEVEKKNASLDRIIEDVANTIVARSNAGSNFGVVLVPEGLIEFVPEIKKLIQEINDVVAEEGGGFSSLASFDAQKDFVQKKISKESFTIFTSIPKSIQEQLLWDRDPHGNVQVSRIETEKLLIEMTKTKLKSMAAKGQYTGKFDYQSHFLGYEGRCGFPSNFDADYCYALGYTAFALAASSSNGYLAVLRGLSGPAATWEAGGIPLVSMMNIEKRHGVEKAVIKKALVDLQGKPFAEFVRHREVWAINTDYTLPGPIQFFGPAELTEARTYTIQLENMQENA